MPHHAVPLAIAHTPSDGTARESRVLRPRWHECLVLCAELASDVVVEQGLRRSIVSKLEAQKLGRLAGKSFADDGRRLLDGSEPAARQVCRLFRDGEHRVSRLDASQCDAVGNQHASHRRIGIDVVLDTQEREATDFFESRATDDLARATGNDRER